VLFHQIPVFAARAFFDIVLLGIDRLAWLILIAFDVGALRIAGASRRRSGLSGPSVRRGAFRRPGTFSPVSFGAGFGFALDVFAFRIVAAGDEGAITALLHERRAADRAHFTGLLSRILIHLFFATSSYFFMNGIIEIVHGLRARSRRLPRFYPRWPSMLAVYSVETISGKILIEDQRSSAPLLRSGSRTAALRL
jgi:hypothetical protein